ncbi:LOW QUALITY PROTEIN: scavenger receptor cysteine-rich type 1 protein M130-like [Enoplosus armatus]|uniref:LOW QUALITY PROTEIN: scavenger receptor cysteine-rich type 1 protein M130-like n=1 Tax=Enoplosus armatus TaxID=215367 RepID=UPI003994923C
MDHRGLIVSLLLWSSGLGAEHGSTAPDDVRLVGGVSHCAGSLEKKHQTGDWRAVDDQDHDWDLMSAAEVCRQLDCGSVVSFRKTWGSSAPQKTIPEFLNSNLKHVFNFGPHEYSPSVEVTCSDSVRLVNGTTTTLCSGRLEVRSNQSNQSWSSVCEADFDQQDVEVVCRELGCGAPSVLQGALYGDVEAPMWTKEFQCAGHESALLDCDNSVRDTCSSGKAVGLSCSEPVAIRLFGGASRCGGTLEIKRQGEWKPVDETNWNLSWAGAVCGQLDCGSAVSTRRRSNPFYRPIWGIKSDCDASSLMKCFTRLLYSSSILEITCSDSVRLVKGTNLCSGRLEVRPNQSNQWWSSVCEDDFNQQDAEVVCRELGCGAPSVFKGGLFGEVEAPLWMRTFQCDGSESALLDCGRSGSARNTCSPGKAVGLTCSDSDDVRLVGGASHCTGRLELKHYGDWKAVDNPDFDWDPKVTAVICRRLDCGSSVSAGRRMDSSEQPPVWWINSSCVLSKSALKECVTTRDWPSYSSLEISCSESVRLVNGTTLCSGRLEVRSNQSNQWWSSVCEADFDQQDAEVVCRELGCGAPLVLQGALYGEAEAPVWTKEFQCEGHESALLDCGGSGSGRHTCSPGKAVGLTCSGPDDIRLVGEASRCAGTLEMENHGEWRPVADLNSEWDQESAAAVCRLLDCGSAVSTTMTDGSSDRPVWWIKSSCVQSASALLECVILTSVIETYSGLEVICSDLLAQPNISCSPSSDRGPKAKQQGHQVLMGSNFTITCSIAPQYQGGSFQLIFTTSNTTQDYTLPAVNHSARFLFPAADHTHQGAYRCVYHIYVFSSNFSSESQPLYLTVSGLQRRENDSLKEIDDIHLVGGSSRCSGWLQVKRHGVWRNVDDRDWDLKSADVVCRYLDCGSAVWTSSKLINSSSWSIAPSCVNSESRLRKCLTKRSISPDTSLEIICSESVRLVNGTSLCSGRLVVKSNQTWSSVCEDNFNQQDAEVVCRELGCGASSVLQGELYGQTEAPMWTKEFQCEGHESALLDCQIDSSGSARDTCSSGKAVGLTCSEPDHVRLVEGSNRCVGELEVKQQGEWKKVDDHMHEWNLKTADVVCRQLDCGSAVSTGLRMGRLYTFLWWIQPTCLQPESAVRECVLTKSDSSVFNLEITCSATFVFRCLSSESVRLVNGTTLCSGRLEVKSNQSNQSWSSVCEDDFDQQDAEVVCRELGCGAPLVLKGALYGEAEPPVFSRGFQCEGSESALLGCGSSGSTRDICLPGKSVELTCSEPDEVQLVGGASPCVGRLEIKHKGDWRPVADSISQWDLMSAAVVCRQLECGSALSTGRRYELFHDHAWMIASYCDSVRLVNGNSLCSGRLEVKSKDSWSSVCEDDIDMQDAEVVCRELSCGAPSVLNRVLHGEVGAPTWTKEFQCEGNESALLDCESSGSVRDTCFQGKAVGITCSELDNVRLFGGASRCDGTLELKQHGEWRPVVDWAYEWDQKLAPFVCRWLDCGSAVSAKIRDSPSDKPMWWIRHSCVQSDFTLRDCSALPSFIEGSINLEVICSDFMAEPNISFSTFIDGVSEAKQQGLQVLLASNFTISCSILPQYPGGSFQLIFTTSNTTQDYTLPAVNHSARFLFPAADHTHQGAYRCVYHIYVFSRNFSSESQPLYLTVSDLIIRLVVLLIVVFSAALFFYCKVTRGQMPRGEDNIDLDHLGGAEVWLGEEAGARGTA